MREELLWVLLAIVLLFVAIPANADHTEEIPITENADGSATIRLTPEQWKVCQAEGGCSVITYTFITEFVRQQAARMCGRGASF